MLPTQRGNTVGGRGNDLGYGKNAKDWVIRSQAPKCSHGHTEKVQRLSGGGQVHACLRYSPAPLKGGLGKKGLAGQEPKDCMVRLSSCAWSNRTTGITGLWQPSVHSDVAF